MIMCSLSPTRADLFRIKGYTIAEGSRTSKGMQHRQPAAAGEGEKVTNMICQSKDATPRAAL